jgi:hypothetical protein
MAGDNLRPWLSAEAATTSATSTTAITPETPNATALPDTTDSNDLNRFFQDPVSFIQHVVESTVHHSAEQYLTDLKEEMELKAAIHTFSKTRPEFERFRPFILQEVADLIQTDPDGHIDPWESLLNKGMERFQEKFRAQVQQGLFSGGQTGKEGDTTRKTPAVIEPVAMRPPKAPMKAFSRQQIARMSLQDFIQNEADIDQALREGRIQ